MNIALIESDGRGEECAAELDRMGTLGAICDPEGGAGARYGSRYRATCYAALDELLSSAEFGAAVVCAPTSTHMEVATRLIRNGKSVFVDRPVPYTYRAGRKAGELARRSGVVLAYSRADRYDAAALRVREIAHTERFGGPRLLEIRSEDAAPRRADDAGIIHDMAARDIDSAMWIFGGSPGMVFALTGRARHDHDDFAAITLDFGDGRAASISSSWNAPSLARSLRAVFAEGTVHSDLASQVGGTGTPGEAAAEPLAPYAGRSELEDFAAAAGAPAGARTAKSGTAKTHRAARVAEAALLSSRIGAPIYLDLR